MDSANLSERLARLSPEKRELLELRLKQRGLNGLPDQTLPRRAASGSAPLSFGQQRLWFLHQLEPESPAYNQPKAVRLIGSLDENALRKALDRIVARHEALRTVFVPVDGVPVQVIAETRPIDLPVADLRSFSEPDRDRETQRLLEEAIRRPFDLRRDLMLRALLLRLADQEHVLLLVTHHIASDGWSNAVLWRELGKLYGAFSRNQPDPLPDLPIQYADYAIWQRQCFKGKVLESQLSYWKKQLHGAATLQLPTDRPRPKVPSYRGDYRSVVLREDLCVALKRLGREMEATLFMTLLGAFQTLLHRYSGHDDIVVGTPIAGRNRPEIEGLIGFFVNTLVMRAGFSDNPSFREVLGRVRQTAFGAYAHQELPFEKLVEELQPERSLNKSPLFQVMFALYNPPRQALQLPGLTLTPLRLGSGTAKFDLFLSLNDESERLTARLEYNRDLFDGATAGRMLDHFETLLLGITAQPDLRVSDLPVLSNDERHRVLREWNQTESARGGEEWTHALFEAQAARSPDAVAVVFEDKQLTYRELNAKSNQLAHYLRSLGAGPETLVGLWMERSLEMVVGLLGILKAGAAYVPLDSTYPKERLILMLQDAGVQVLLTQQKPQDRDPLSSLIDPPLKVLCLDAESGIIAGESEENPVTGVVPDNLAYVIYTSGSTGRPKGVQISHRALANFLGSMREQSWLDEKDTLLAVTTLSFDIAALELYLPLIAGARVALVSRQVAADPPRLLEKLLEYRPTVMQATPTTWQMLVEAGWNGDNRLTMLSGGEALSRALANRLLTKGSSLWNLYGPTEATVWATCHKVAAAAEPVPIGRPIAGAQVYVLDRHGQPLPPGVPGELYVGGSGVGRGYLNRPDLTAEKFIPHPFSNDGQEPGARLYRTGDLARYLPDGNVEFLGRIDDQIKIRGFRVEPGEIEAALGRHPSVQAAVVLAREHSLGDRRLIAYVVAGRAEASSANDLGDFIKKTLPDYMVPSAFVFLDDLPLMPNGKIDRRALPAPDGNRPDLQEAFVAPRNQTEQKLAAIWADLLGVDTVGIHDSFFDLGGHSLLAVRLFTRMEKEFNKRLPLSILFERPTIEHLANMMSRPTPPNGSSSLVLIQPRGSKLPFFCVHELFGDVLCYMNLARRLGDDRPFYAVQAKGLNGADEPFTDIESMAAYYVKEIRAVQPHGPYALGGICIGGVVAFEMAQQLRVQGEAVALVALLDSAASTSRGRVAWWSSFLRNLPGDLPSWLIGSLQLNRAQWSNLIRLKISKAKARLSAGARISKEGSAQSYSANLVEEMGELFHFSEQHRKVAHAQQTALSKYTPKPYPGRLTLFRARMQPLFSSHSPDKGWSRLAAGGLEIKSVPGNHAAMLQEPHVRVLAEQLRACLDKAEPSHGEKRSVD